MSFPPSNNRLDAPNMNNESDDIEDSDSPLREQSDEKTDNEGSKPTPQTGPKYQDCKHTGENDHKQHHSTGKSGPENFSQHTTSSGFNVQIDKNQNDKDRVLPLPCNKKEWYPDIKSSEQHIKQVTEKYYEMVQAKLKSDLQEGKSGLKNIAGTYRMRILNDLRKICGGVELYTKRVKEMMKHLKELKKEKIIEKVQMGKGLEHVMVGIRQSEIQENFEQLTDEEIILFGSQYEAILSLDLQSYEDLDRFLLETSLMHELYWKSKKSWVQTANCFQTASEPVQEILIDLFENLCKATEKDQRAYKYFCLVRKDARIYKSTIRAYLDKEEETSRNFDKTFT